MTNSIVTIIMPARNAMKTIAQSIQSVLNQSFQDWTLLIIEDASTDDTAKIVRGFCQQDPRIRLICQSEWGGVAAARNYALQQAQTQYIAFLDSDDYWEPQKLALQLDFMRSNATAVTYSSYRRVNSSGETLGIVTPPKVLTYEQLLRANFIGNLTTLFDRRQLPELWFKNIGNEDYLFWLEALKALDQAILITPSEQPLANYRVTTTSLSGNKWRSARWQWAIYRRNLHFGLLKSFVYMVSYTYYSLLKRRG